MSGQPRYDVPYLRLLAQGALCDQVTEPLIAVTCGYAGTGILVRAYFSGRFKEDDDEVERIRVAGTEMIAGFPSPWMLAEQIFSLDEHPLEMLDFWAFRRRMGPRRPRAVGQGLIYSEQPRGNLLCALQDALLDEVTSGLVQVDTAYVASGGSPEIPIWAYFSRPITQDDEQTFRDVAARVAACFPPHCVVVPRCLPWPQDTPSGRPDYSGYPDRTVLCVFAVKRDA